MASIMDVKSAVGLIKDGAVVLSGGFYGNGTPAAIVTEMIAQKKKDLTVANNDGNTVEKGVGRLVAAGLVKKFICTWCGRLPLAPELAEKGEMELEINPQGTFVERIRAAGFGLGGVLTPSGLNTMVEEKWGERVTLNGKDWLYHTPLHGDVAIVEADRADAAGNLVFHLTQRAFSVAMCTAADLVIVEVSKPIEPVGAIDPELIHVPGMFVDVLVPMNGVMNYE
ncbi:MAG: CoA transferase subunit A [Rhodospirillaceae bacterium]